MLGNHRHFRQGGVLAKQEAARVGIRLALGGQRKEFLEAALGRAFKLLAFGSATGLLLACWPLRCSRSSGIRRVHAIPWCCRVLFPPWRCLACWRPGFPLGARSR